MKIPAHTAEYHEARARAAANMNQPALARREMRLAELVRELNSPMTAVTDDDSPEDDSV